MTSLVTRILFKFSLAGVNFPPLGTLNPRRKLVLLMTSQSHYNCIADKSCLWLPL